MSFKFNFNAVSDSEIPETENLNLNNKFSEEADEYHSRPCDILPLTNENLQVYYLLKSFVFCFQTTKFNFIFIL